MPTIVFALFAIVAVLSGAMAQSPEHCFVADFSTTQNPFGVWSLGLRSGSITNPGPFALLDTPQNGGWKNGGTYPDVTPSSGTMTFHPSDSQEAVIRYTAAANQLAVITVTTTDFYPTHSAAHNVVLRHGDTAVSGPHNSKNPVNINTQVAMLAGETIELALNSLGDNSRCRVAPTFCVTADPHPATQDPAVAAFCDEIEGKCTSMAGECDTLRTLNHIPVSPPNHLFATNRHLYRVVPAGVVTYATARAQAQAIGAGWDLATITTTAEFNFIAGLLGPTAGATRAYTVGGFRCPTCPGFDWVTGEPFNNAFFGGPEPNNGANVQAGMDNRYGWEFNDYADAHIGGYVVGFVAEKHTAEPDSEMPDDCDASVAACNAMEVDCREKAASCPVV